MEGRSVHLLHRHVSKNKYTAYREDRMQCFFVFKNLPNGQYCQLTLSEKHHLLNALIRTCLPPPKKNGKLRCTHEYFTPDTHACCNALLLHSHLRACASQRFVPREAGTRSFAINPLDEGCPLQHQSKSPAIQSHPLPHLRASCFPP